MSGFAFRFFASGVACVLVHDIKKDFYKKFLYEPFPVESSLLDVLPDHLNAEVVAGTISTLQEAVDYLTWTYFFRRLLQNPAYYGLEEVRKQSQTYSTLLDKTLHSTGKSCRRHPPYRTTSKKRINMTHHLFATNSHKPSTFSCWLFSMHEIEWLNSLCKHSEDA